MTNVPEGWAQAPISELLEQNIGGVWGKPPSVEEVEVSVVRVADFRDDGTFDLPSTPRRSVTARQLQSRELRPGDILLEKSGGGPTKPVGRAVRMRAATDHVVPTNFVQLLRPNPAVDSGFLFWWLWWSHLNGSTNEFQRATTNIRNLRTKDYLDQPCPLPPLNEQGRIVAAIEVQFSRLDAADEWVSRAETRALLLRASVYSAALRGEWPTAHLGELLREPLRNGHSARASREGKVRTLTLTAVTRGAFTDENTKVTGADPMRIENLWLEPGDVLIERSNTPELVGTAALYDGPRRWAIFPDLVIRVRVNDELLPEFLAITLKSQIARRYFRASAQGIAGSMPKIDQGIIERLEISVPPTNEQQRIVEEVERQLSLIDAMRHAIDTANRRSATLRRSILAQAFRGELVPPDPADEHASVLLARIANERPAIAPKRRRTATA